MERRLRVMTVCAGTCVAGGVCAATPVSFGPGGGGTIAKATVGGAGQFQSSITVSDSRTVNNVTALLSSLVHNWMGELSARLTHVPSGRTALLFDRIGSGPGNASGDSSDFVGHYTFADGGQSLIAAAAATGATSPIPSGTYAASGAGGAAVSLASAFAGVTAAGEWRLVIQNFGQTDVGSLSGWTLGLDLVDGSVVPMPSGGALAIGGLGVMWTVRRRREG